MSTQPLTGPEPLGCDECYDPGCPGVAAQEEAFEARFEAEASLTPAEAAVVAVLSGESECSWHIGCDEECHEPRARAVVAAVYDLIATEARYAAADGLLALAPEQATSDAKDAFWRAAAIVRAASLSLPASKETPSE